MERVFDTSSCVFSVASFVASATDRTFFDLAVGYDDSCYGCQAAYAT